MQHRTCYECSVVGDPRAANLLHFATLHCMASTTPVRIDEGMFAAAQAAASVMSRSAAQQVVHWARIGMELESAPAVDFAAVARALAYGEAYDRLTGDEQAIVRAAWAERIEAATAQLRLDEEFAAEGRGWVEIDADGALVHHPAGDR